MEPLANNEQERPDFIPPTQESIDNARRKAEQALGNVGTEEIKYLRARCKNDLFFLATWALGYKKLTVRLHGNYCSWLQNTAADRFRIKLMPRGHYKTTIDTISESIQSVLPPIGGEIYPRNLSGNLRLAIVHEVADEASKFLFEITNHFCGNPRLMGLFPELVPNPRKHRINKKELELPRSEFWKEPTFDTYGVGARSQGNHYDWIKLDDIYGDKARDSVTERDTTIQWFDNLPSFFVEFDKSFLDITGTHYDLDDVYMHAMEVYGESLKRYIRRVREKNLETGKMEPIFPEVFNEEGLVRLQKNPKVWVQYTNDPIAGKSKFDIEWLKYYNIMENGRLAVFTGDSREIIEPAELDRVILWDPSAGGPFGLTLTATDRKRVFVLKFVVDRLPPEKQLDMVFDWVMKYRPRTVAVEKVNFSALFEHWAYSEMKNRNLRFHITPVKPRKPGSGSKSKTERIEVLAPYFSSGQIFIAQGMMDFIDEYQRYGATIDIHGLDALAYGPEVWHFTNPEQMKRNRELEQQLLDSRDKLTGYSKI